jgi:hypothetical protein
VLLPAYALHRTISINLEIILLPVKPPSPEGVQLTVAEFSVF